eukprot:5953961-Amphidinium_carterae.1
MLSNPRKPNKTTKRGHTATPPCEGRSCRPLQSLATQPKSLSMPQRPAGEWNGVAKTGRNCPLF